MGKVLNPINKPEEEIIVGAETGADGTSVIVGDTAGAAVPGVAAAPAVTPTFTVGALQDKNTFLGDNGYTVDRAAYDQKFGFQNTYEGWLDSQGLDPDADFQNARNELEYERKTWDAGYGERAEQLYQMGLTNSGVSDIYGANAFSSYLSAMNDLNVARINTDKQLKKEYNDYVTSFNTGFDEHVAKGNAAYREYESGYKSTLGNYVAQAYNTVLSSYNGNNEDELRSTLVAHGYDDVIINETLARLGTLDKTALGNARVLEGYEAVKDAYTGPASAGAVTQMLQKLNRTDSEIASILQMLEAGYAASPEGQAAAVQDIVRKYQSGYDFVGSDGIRYSSESYNPADRNAVMEQMRADGVPEEQINEAIAALDTAYYEGINAAVEAYSELYTPELSEQIGNTLVSRGYSERDAMDVINLLDSNYRLIKSAEQNAAEGNKGANINAAVVTYSSMYNGTENSELLIRNMLGRDNTFNADDINTIIDDIKAGYQAGKDEEEASKPSTTAEDIVATYGNSYNPIDKEAFGNYLKETIDPAVVDDAINRLDALYNLPSAVAQRRANIKSYIYESSEIIPESVIRNNLSNAGYNEDDINAAYDDFKTESADIIEHQKNTTVYPDPTKDQMLSIIGQYLKGENKYAEYAAKNPDLDYDAIDMAIVADGDNPFAGWIKVSGGGWKLGKLDDNAQVADPYGNVYTIKEIYEKLLPFAGKEKAKEYLVKLQQKTGVATTENFLW
jgi:SOS response regulatory protein OraA/RecX